MHGSESPFSLEIGFYSSEISRFVRFCAATCPDSVSKPVFSEPDPVSVKKYRNGSRNRIFPSISVCFHRYLRLVCLWEVPMPNIQGAFVVHLVVEG
jgi:hypothetical protein